MHTMPFPGDRIALKRIYTGKDYRGFTEKLLSCPKVDNVYGDFMFPEAPEERSYTFGSFVVSIDGRIAYPASPDGNLVAKTNRLDPDGGLCDYWILNLLRAVCDAVIMGSLTIKRESELTGRVYDGDLLEQRIADGKTAVPLHVLVSASGANLPLDHLLYREQEIPTLTAVSPAGAASLGNKHPEKFTILPEVSGDRDLHSLPAGLDREGTNYLIGCGKDSVLDPLLLMKALRRMGIRRSLIETPTFLASLMERGALDELFLNTSGIFIGGKAITIGENFPPFTPERHPHTKVLTIHSHSDSFFYTRYRFSYDGG
jgi:riboflavin biosynthesis pyrimidine reductase